MMAAMSTRVALILRPVPPALAALPEDSLRGCYYHRLWDGWSLRQRALARGLTAARYAAAARKGALAAWRLGFAPTMFAEVEARRRPDATLAGFLDQDERKGVHALLNPGALPFDANPLKNKARFAAFCAAHGLPAPRAGPGADGLIVKPRYGSKGRGVRRLERRDGQWVANDGEIIAALNMSRWVAAQEAGGMIVQELLRTDPALRTLSPGALPTLRITTCLDERGRPEVADVALRLSLGDDRAADNFNADNLVCGVDRATGLVGPALRRIGGGFAELAAHPVTRAPIAGETLATLDAAMALACRAHAPLAAGFTVIGWDIGLAEGGPALIEGNWNPGYNVMQLVHGRGLGEMRLGQLYRHHLDRLPAAMWRAAAPVELAQRRL